LQPFFDEVGWCVCIEAHPLRPDRKLDS
jgi:hypothetical protein